MPRSRLSALLAPAALAGVLLNAPAEAADGPLGIGFAQAEEGTWWCNGAAPGPALDCALRKCTSESGGQACHPTRWCYPAGWSALMVVWLPEFHSTHVVCGMPGEAGAEAAMQSICKAGSEFSRCDLVLFIDPDGNQSDPVGTSWPGPAATGAASP